MGELNIIEEADMRYYPQAHLSGQHWCQRWGGLWVVSHIRLLNDIKLGQGTSINILHDPVSANILDTLENNFLSFPSDQNISLLQIVNVGKERVRISCCMLGYCSETPAS